MLRTLSMTTAGLLALTGAAFAQTETNSGGSDCTSSVMIDRGDTLGKIAERCAVSLAALMQANPTLEPRRLKIGERVNLPGSGASATDASSGAAEGEATASGSSYTIRAGDTLYAIAQEQSISLAALREANPGVNPRRLRIGQSLMLPASASSSAAYGDSASGDATAGAGAPGYGAGSATGGTGTPGYGAGSSTGTAGTPGYGAGSSTGSPGGADYRAGSPAGTQGTPGTSGTSGVAGSSGAAQPGQASITVSPASGVAGSRITISGSNFSPGEAIEISFARAGGEPTPIGQVQASEQGDFSAQTTAPGNATAGLQLVFYARGAGGQTVQTQPFMVGGASAPGTPNPNRNN